MRPKHTHTHRAGEVHFSGVNKYASTLERCVRAPSALCRTPSGRRPRFLAGENALGPVFGPRAHPSCPGLICVLGRGPGQLYYFCNRPVLLFITFADSQKVGAHGCAHSFFGSERHVHTQIRWWVARGRACVRACERACEGVGATMMAPHHPPKKGKMVGSITRIIRCIFWGCCWCARPSYRRRRRRTGL